MLLQCKLVRYCSVQVRLRLAIGHCVETRAIVSKRCLVRRGSSSHVLLPPHGLYLSFLRREHKKTCTPAMESGLSITRLRQFWGSVAAFRQLVELLFIAEFKLDKVSDSTTVAAPVVAKTPIMMGCLRVYLHPIDTRKFSALLDLRLNPPDMITICPPDSPASPLRCRPYFYDFRETTNIEEAEIDSMRPMMADHKRDARLVFKNGVGVPEEGAELDPDVADGFLEIHLDNTGQSVQMPFTVRESTLESYRNGDIWLAGPYKPPLPYTKEAFLE